MLFCCNFNLDMERVHKQVNQLELQSFSKTDTSFSVVRFSRVAYFSENLLCVS